MAADIAAVVGNHQGELVLRDCLESLTRRRGRRIRRSSSTARRGPQRRACRGARRARSSRAEPRPRLPLQPRSARGRVRLRPVLEQRRRVRTGLPRAARRRARRRRRVASRRTRRSSAGTTGASSTRARSSARPPLARVPAGPAPRRRRARRRRRPDGQRARRRDAGQAGAAPRARPLRRVVLHGVGGPRPLLARVAARVVDASTCPRRACATAWGR